MTLSLCLIAAGKLTVLGATAFTLTWSHSVERSAWEEDWRLTAQGLEIVEARIKGSGAGMDPPEGAVFSGGWWRYRPAYKPLEQLRLATSMTVEPWQLCTPGACLTLLAEAGTEEVIVARCPSERQKSLSHIGER